MMQWEKSLATQHDDMFQALGLTHMVEGENQLHMFPSEVCMNNIPTQTNVEKIHSFYFIEQSSKRITLPWLVLYKAA